MTNQNVLAAIIAVFVSLILFIAGIIFSSDPYQDIPQQSTSEQRDTTGSISDQRECANVSEPEYQSCCESWFSENQLSKPTCVGSWQQSEESICTWQCSTEQPI